MKTLNNLIIDSGNLLRVVAKVKNWSFEVSKFEPQ